MILLIDNYDSFSYNLFQQAAAIEPDMRVVRNDALTIGEIEGLNPSHIILSPGPGYPKDAGICEDVVRCLGDHIPILGVCLGHQAICEVYGATISHARCLMHGKQSCIKINTDSLIFRGLPEEVPVARYHSLAAQRDTMPDCLTIIGEDAYGEVMAVKHRDFPVYGLQFHPESILTPDGKKMMRNFLLLQ